MPTKYGVYYDLKESEYEALAGGLLFVFSSKSHLDKFRRDLDKKQAWLTDSLSRRFGVPVNAQHLAAVQLYQQIEKRGFLVKDMLRGEKCYTSPSQMPYSIHLMREGVDYNG